MVLALALAMAVVVVALAARDHRRTRAARWALLEQCRPLLTDGRITFGGDGFPRLEGLYGDHRVVSELIADTMTVKRLPQLWHSLSILYGLPLSSSFSVLVRPSGNDFYSLTEKLDATLSPPREFPWEVLVRGAGHNPQGLVDDLASEIGAILYDPRVKELCVTPQGLRIIHQAAEGRRGEHLLLRQAAFDIATIAPSQFVDLLSALQRLQSSVLKRASRSGVAA